jgi:hypothetical protein
MLEPNQIQEFMIFDLPEDDRSLGEWIEKQAHTASNPASDSAGFQSQLSVVLGPRFEPTSHNFGNNGTIRAHAKSAQ